MKIIGTNVGGFVITFTPPAGGNNIEQTGAPGTFGANTTANAVGQEIVWKYDGLHLLF